MCHITLVSETKGISISSLITCFRDSNLFLTEFMFIWPIIIENEIPLNCLSRESEGDTVFPLISAGPQISAAPLVIHIEISASSLISAAPLNVALIRIVAIFY